MTHGHTGVIITSPGDITDFISITIISIIRQCTGHTGGIHGIPVIGDMADTILITTADMDITADTGFPCIIMGDMDIMIITAMVPETGVILQKEVQNWE